MFHAQKPRHVHRDRSVHTRHRDAELVRLIRAEHRRARRAAKRHILRELRAA